MRAKGHATTFTNVRCGSLHPLKIMNKLRLFFCYLTLLTILTGCNEDGIEPEPQPFPLIYEVVNSGNYEILADISALAYFPNEDITNSIYKNFRELERGDTGVYVADRNLAYEGCERVLTVNTYLYVDSTTSYIHWTFNSGIDTLSDISDQLLRFTWPNDSSTFQLIATDTIPWN